MSTQPQLNYDLTKLNFERQEQAAIITDGENYYYRYDTILLDISRSEFERARDNPQLYYFSTALKLQQRAKRVYQLHQALIATQGQRPGPDEAAALPHQYALTVGDKRFDIVRLRIRQSPSDPYLRQQSLDLLNRTDKGYAFIQNNDNNYWAEVIRNGPHFFYRIGDTLIDIDKKDYCRVIQNPILYHLSTALYLHRRIGRIEQIKAQL